MLGTRLFNSLMPTTVPEGTLLAPVQLLKIIRCSCESDMPCIKTKTKYLVLVTRTKTNYNSYSPLKKHTLKPTKMSNEKSKFQNSVTITNCTMKFAIFQIFCIVFCYISIILLLLFLIK